MIYFDNAATTLNKPDGVAEAVYNAITTMGNASRGGYDSSLNSERIIFSAREKLSKMFNSKTVNSVAFTLNATEALNTAIKGIVTLKEKEHIITTELEHNSVLRPLYELEEKGVEITFIKSDKNGNINYSDIEKSLKHNTKAIVITHASNVTGNITDIDYIGDICKKHDLLFILDASQTAGAFKIDMQKNNISVICFTGHKSLMGPQGTGGICVKEGVEIKPLKTGGSGIKSFYKTHPIEMPTRLEAGTLNSHGIAGLNASLDFIEKTGIEKIREKEKSLMKMFYEEVKNIDGVTIYGDYTTYIKAPIVSLNILDFDSSLVSGKLSSLYNIATRSGTHCAPLLHRALSLENRGAVRFSFSYFNTFEEIEIAIKAIKYIAS